MKSVTFTWKPARAISLALYSPTSLLLKASDVTMALAVGDSFAIISEVVRNQDSAPLIHRPKRVLVLLPSRPLTRGRTCACLRFDEQDRLHNQPSLRCDCGGRFSRVHG